MSWLFLFSPYLCVFIYLYTFFSFSLLLQSFHIITHLILPAIWLTFYACSVVVILFVLFFILFFYSRIRLSLCTFTNVGAFSVLMYVNVFQCLQRIWKKASGRWRGSCSSWSETWRLLPPQTTQTTCSSQKWLYPLHMHAFVCRSGG